MISLENKKTIEFLCKKNTFIFNKLKTIEECGELITALSQTFTKDAKPNEKQIIDEIGDVYIRLEILSDIYSKELVQKRITEKLHDLLIKYEKYTNV